LDERVVFKNLLLQNQKAILERWLHLILETYPADTSALFKKEKDQFINPVGSTISREIETLFEELLQDMNSDRLSASLSAILKIRSVQDFSPSRAVGFVFLLKKAIQDVLGIRIDEKQILEEWLKFQSKIDKLALQAFDIYMDCREKICEVRVNRARAEREMALKMLERMYGLKEKPEKGESGNS
jgi:hypothetical protein